MIQGLHHQLAEMRREAETKRLIANDPASAPFIGYSAHEDVTRLEREMVRVQHSIIENLSLISHIAEALRLLANSDHRSRLRSLAITDLEQAQDRIRRELGDKPSDTQP